MSYMQRVLKELLRQQRKALRKVERIEAALSRILPSYDGDLL